MSNLSTGLSRDERSRATGRPLTVGVREACALTGLGPTKVWDLIGKGRLKVTRIDRRTLVFVASIEKLLEEGAT